MLKNTGKLAGKTIFITGASRGIGKEIALKCAKDGANIIIAAKTVTAHPKLPGTIYTAAEEVEKAGGKCLPVVMDVRDENNVKQCVEDAVKKFGGIDILINNASAISLTGTEQTEIKKYDLMHQVNVRGTFITSKMCIPYLKKSPGGGRILMNSPPLLMSPRWFAPHVAYTMTKFGMSMCVLGMAEELKTENIAVNTVWPKTSIYTAATAMLAGDADTAMSASRKPDIMADAAYAILCKPTTFTGNFCIDEAVLKDEGIKDFSVYDCKPGCEPQLDFFLPDEYYKDQSSMLETQGGKVVKSEGGVGLGQIFAMLKPIINEDLVKKTGGVFLFQVKDKGDYFIDLKNGAGDVGKGEPPSKADCTFVMDAEVLTKMFQGALKPTAAFMTGKLKIKGDMGKAMKLEKLLGQVKSKL